MLIMLIVLVLAAVMVEKGLLEPLEKNVADLLESNSSLLKQNERLITELEQEYKINDRGERYIRKLSKKLVEKNKESLRFKIEHDEQELMCRIWKNIAADNINKIMQDKQKYERTKRLKRGLCGRRINRKKGNVTKRQLKNAFEEGWDKCTQNL